MDEQVWIITDRSGITANGYVNMILYEAGHKDVRVVIKFNKHNSADGISVVKRLEIHGYKQIGDDIIETVHKVMCRKCKKTFDGKASKCDCGAQCDNYDIINTVVKLEKIGALQAHIDELFKIKGTKEAFQYIELKIKSEAKAAKLEKLANRRWGYD